MSLKSLRAFSAIPRSSPIRLIFPFPQSESTLRKVKQQLRLLQSTLFELGVDSRGKFVLESTDKKYNQPLRGLCGLITKLSVDSLCGINPCAKQTAARDKISKQRCLANEN